MLKKRPIHQIRGAISGAIRPRTPRPALIRKAKARPEKAQGYQAYEDYIATQYHSFHLPSFLHHAMARRARGMSVSLAVCGRPGSWRVLSCSGIAAIVAFTEDFFHQRFEPCQGGAYIGVDLDLLT